MITHNYSFNFYNSKKIFFPKNINELRKKASKGRFTTIGNLRSYNDSAIGNNPIS